MKETLTKKLGPLPVYMWVALAALGVGAFLLWRRSQTTASNTATSNNTPNASGTLPDATGYAVIGGYGDNSQQGFNNNPNPVTQGPGTTFSPQPLPGVVGSGGPMPQPPPAVKQGSGYWVPNSEAPVQNVANKLWYMWISPQTSPGYTGPRYVQTSPGVFTTMSIASMLPGTPQFMPSAPPATPVTVAPGLTAQPQSLIAGQGTPLNPGSPASAIAPSALQPITQ